MAHYPEQEHGLFLSTQPAGRGERRLALGVVLVSTAMFFAAVPFATIPLRHVAAFIPAYEAALLVCNLITAVLLLGQFRIHQSRALLVLACAYLFSGLMALMHVLSFPGLVAPAGLLGAGTQTTAWLFYLWHAGFPLGIIAYALIDGRARALDAPKSEANAAILSGAAVTGLIVCAMVLVTTEGHDALPAILRDNNKVPGSNVISSLTWLVNFIALSVLWRRPRTVLNVWLMVVMCAWLFDIALAAVLNGGRFTFGWYAGRVYGMLAATFVLLALLIENIALYAKLAAAHARHTRQLKILYEIDLAVTARHSSEAIARAVVQPLLELLGAQRVVVSFCDFESGEVAWVGAADVHGTNVRGHHTHVGAGMHHSINAMGDVTALQRGESQAIITQALADGAEKNRLLAAGVRVQTVMPMIAGGKLIGAVRFGGEGDMDSPEQTRIAREVTIQLAIAIAQTRLNERVAAQAQEIGRSEARLRGVLDSAMDAIITVDENERVVIFNAAAEATFGWPRGEALGAPLAQFIPERLRVGHALRMRSFGESGTTSRRLGTRFVTGLRRNGEEFPMEASISHTSGRDGRLFTAILHDVTERIRREEALRKSNEERGEFAAMATAAREQERSRVARELHDDLAQTLAALQMDMAWMQKRLAPEQKELQNKIVAIRDTIRGAATATRRISADLRPLVLEELGLFHGAMWLVENFRQRTGIDCEIAIDPPELELKGPQSTAVFRILQESLANVAKHAQASRVEVKLQARNAHIAFMLSDNGRGFLLDDPRKSGSTGLAGLRERARLVDGDITIDSALGRGTTIEVRIPLQ